MHNLDCVCPACADEILSRIAAADTARRMKKRGKHSETGDVYDATVSIPPDIERAIQRADGRLKRFSPLDDPGDLND